MAASLLPHVVIRHFHWLGGVLSSAAFLASGFLNAWFFFDDNIYNIFFPLAAFPLDSLRRRLVVDQVNDLRWLIRLVVLRCD